jgi:hypothetical protein
MKDDRYHFYTDGAPDHFDFEHFKIYLYLLAARHSIAIIIELFTIIRFYILVKLILKFINDSRWFC